MADLSQLSNEELMAIAGVKPDVSQLSDAELMKIAGVQTTAPEPAKSPLMLGDKPLPDIFRYGATPPVKLPGALGDISRGFLEQLPVAGMVAGGAAGTALGGPFGAAAGAGLGGGIGAGARGLIQETMGLRPPKAPMENIQDIGKETATGVFSETLAGPITNLAQKIFAPAIGKVTAGTTKAVDWLKEKAIPYSADILGTMPGKISQTMADWGLGGFLTDSARKKTVAGISQAAEDVMISTGLKSKGETGSELAQALSSLGNMELTFTEFNKALKSLPKDQTFPMYGVLDGLMSLGKGNDEMALQQGLKAIKRLYPGGRGDSLRQTFNSIVERGGLATPEEIGVLSGYIRKGGGNYLGTQREYGVNRMKESLMADFETMFSPNGESLATLRKAADTAMSEAYRYLEEVGAQTGLVFKDVRNKWQPSLRPENYESAVNKIFRKDYEPMALKLRDNLLDNGMTDLWDSIKLSFIKDAFDQATPATGKIGERVFQPKKYLDWFNENSEQMAKIMPEHMDNLNLWADISRLVSTDFQKAGGGGVLEKLLTTGSLGTVGFLGLGKAGAAVPLMFSPIAAVLTMWPNVNFLTRYATKSELGAMGNIFSQIPQFMARSAISEYGPLTIDAVNNLFSKKENTQ